MAAIVQLNARSVRNVQQRALRTANHEGECQGTCQVCLKTRRMVSATVANSISEIIDYLRQDNLPIALKQAIAFVDVLGEVPTSTLQLIGANHFFKLQATAERGLHKITAGEVHEGAAAFQAGLDDWYDAYPPYTV
jgi:hypothetical protein